VRQIPQPGDIVAIRTWNQGSAVSLHGAVLVARRDEPLQSEATDLSNVVPFTRSRRRGAAPAFPLPSVAADERPAPHAAKFGVGRGIALVAGSLALHSALLAMFWHEPKPMASIAIEAMTVEITLGATTAAGLAPTPSERDAPAATPSEQQAENEPESEPLRTNTVVPQEVLMATQDTAPEAKPEDAPSEAQSDPTPQAQRPESVTAEAPAMTQSTERALQPTEQPRPQFQVVPKASERKRVAATTDTKAVQKKQKASTAAKEASSGVGRGRSDNSANYNAIVFAHLARHKATRGDGAQGVATVSFSIDGGGRVTSARLVRASGNAAIDQEVVALARRASPFPPPSDGRARSFTIPVRFNSL
jgi:protein TonB